MPKALHKVQDRKAGDLKMAFGVAPQAPQDLEAELSETPAIKKLLQQTEEGTLRFWFPGHQRVKGAPSQFPRLFDEVIAARQEYMHLAIHQALAGPPDTETLPSNDFVGRPVTDLVGIIYRDHLNNANRREKTRRKREGQGAPPER